MCLINLLQCLSFYGGTRRFELLPPDRSLTIRKAAEGKVASPTSRRGEGRSKRRRLSQNTFRLSPAFSQAFAQPLRRDRQLDDRAGNADGLVDRGGDRGADRVGAAFAGTLEAQVVQWARCVLGDDHVDRRHFVRGGNEVIGEGDGERLAALVVEGLLEQRAAQPPDPR